jgi:hypothetical protein
VPTDPEPDAHPGSDDRLRIASRGSFDSPHRHLDPVVEAELRWGNRIAEHWFVDRRVGSAILRLREPLHVDLLRRTFVFPPGFRLRTVGPRPDREPTMALADAEHVGISGPLPPGFPAVDAEIPL